MLGLWGLGGAILRVISSRNGDAGAFDVQRSTCKVLWKVLLLEMYAELSQQHPELPRSPRMVREQPICSWLRGSWGNLSQLFVYCFSPIHFKRVILYPFVVNLPSFPFFPFSKFTATMDENLRLSYRESVSMAWCSPDPAAAGSVPSVAWNRPLFLELNESNLR